MASLKLPNGTLGLIVSSTNEAQQEDLFFPCEPRLFAVNVAGDPQCGSLVFDLNKANEPDSARGAYLQSAFRVVKLPLGQPNAIAFQLDLTGRKDTQGGFFCEIMQAPVAAQGAPDTKGGPGTTVVQGAQPPMPDKGGFGFGEGSHNFGGPFHVGVVGDKHFHGEDADGNPINALHLWTEGNFFKNRLADGPIRFELEYKEGDERDFIVPVHLAWTGADWALWTSTDFYVPRPGRIVPQQPIRPLDPRFPNFDFAPFQPLPEPLPNTIFNTPTNTVFEGVIDGRVVGSGIAPNMVATLSALMAPAMVFRPENYDPDTTSTGLFDFAEGSGEGGGSIEKAKKADSSSPITAMASAFGAQGGIVNSGGSGGGTYVGGEGDPWVYTQTPRGNITTGKKMSKYPGGTASGGIVYHPPETDLRDIADGMVPDNVTLSDVLVMCAPNAAFAVGIPDLANGAVNAGYSWEYDSATGDSVFYSHAASVASEAIRLTGSTQLIEWRSGQSFSGTFSHTNTADRTWTFPDVTSTISSMLFDTVAPTATATEGTFGWDTVANNLYVNSDGASTWQFIGGASSVTGSGVANQLTYWTGTRTVAGDAGFTINAATDVLTVVGGVTISALTATRVLFAGVGGAISGDAGLTYNSATDVLTLLGTSAGWTLAYDGTSQVATTISTLGRLRYTLTGTGPEIRSIGSVDADFASSIENSNAGASAGAVNLITTSGSGDSVVQFSGGGATWTAGLDQSLSRFALARVSTLGTSADLLRIGFNSDFQYVGQAYSTGAADEFIHHDFNVAGGTITLTTGVLLATQRAVRFRRPTYAATGATQTITNAATVYIENAPAAGANLAITNPYALWVDDGAVRLDGWLNVGTATDAAAQGDFAAGLTGAARLFYDQSVPILYSYNSAGTIVNQLSSVAATATVFNEQGADIDFRVEGDTDANLLFCDASTDRVGIGTTGPDAKLDVLSTSTQLRLTYTDATYFTDFTTTASGQLTVAASQTVSLALFNNYNKLYLMSNLVDDANRRNWGFIGEVAAVGDFNIRVSSTNTGQPDTTMVNITRSGLVTTGVGGWIGNEAGADVDFRWESDDEPYCLMVEGTLNNVVMCATTEPAFQSMDGGVFLAEANVVPTGNPTAGIYIYVQSGAGKARGTGGTITTWAPAEPHCEVCGTDYGHEWENTRWGRLQFCVNCLADDVAKRNGGELPKWIKRERIGA